MIKFNLLLFIFIFNTEVYSAYSMQEQRFFTSQVDSIKSEWHKIQQNESAKFINLADISSNSTQLISTQQKIKNCSTNDVCLAEVNKLLGILKSIENQCIKKFEEIGFLTIKDIEKNNFHYTKVIKNISDMINIISENQIYLFEILKNFSDFNNQSTFASYQSDLLLKLDKLIFKIDGLGNLLLKKEVENLLVLGKREFIDLLKRNISEIKIEELHELDKIFNVINRDLLKNEVSLSSSSKNIMMIIHQRWNSILKIVKRM